MPLGILAVAQSLNTSWHAPQQRTDRNRMSDGRLQCRRCYDSKLHGDDVVKYLASRTNSMLIGQLDSFAPVKRRECPDAATSNSYELRVSLPHRMPWTRPKFFNYGMRFPPRMWWARIDSDQR